MNGQVTSGINAGMRFLAGWMDATKEQQEKKKRDRMQQTFINLGKQENMEYQYTYDSTTGAYKVTIKPKKIVEEKPEQRIKGLARGATGLPGGITPRATDVGLAPFGIPVAGGGFIPFPQGTRAEAGQIISPEGRVRGEYTPGAGGFGPLSQEQINAVLLSQFERAGRRGVSVPGMRAPKIEEKAKPNTATQKQLTLLAQDIKDGKIRTISDVERIVEENREAFEMNQVDIEYILFEARRLLPETFEKGRRGFFGAGKKYPRKQKFGIWYEKREDGLWHKVRE